MKAWLKLATAFALIGCSAPTELVVVTNTDLGVPDEIDEIVFLIVGPDGALASRTAPLSGQGAVELPVTVVLLHEEGAIEPVEIRAVGRLSGAEVVRRDAVASFVRGRSVLVPLDLARTCRGATCPSGTTCVDGACVEPPRIGPDAGPPTVDGGVSPSVDSGPFDPGPLDAGPLDAGPPPVDAGPPCASGCACVQSCEGDCECASGCGCDLYCAPGADCMSGKCKDVGTTCTVSARDAEDVSHTCEHDARCVIDVRGVSNVDRISCKSGASCEVDCTGASNCYVECRDDAECLVDCSGTSNCTISDCGELDDDEGLRSCGDGILVCRRACP